MTPPRGGEYTRCLPERQLTSLSWGSKRKSSLTPLLWEFFFTHSPTSFPLHQTRLLPFSYTRNSGETVLTIVSFDILLHLFHSLLATLTTPVQFRGGTSDAPHTAAYHFSCQLTLAPPSLCVYLPAFKCRSKTSFTLTKHNAQKNSHRMYGALTVNA